VNRTLDVASSFAATLARAGSGLSVGELGPRPEEPLALYEFEGCPYCHKVRAALSVLDLDAHVMPCPKRGTRFRPALEERGGKQQFPYLVDPNSGKEMYESDDIVRYLFRTYGTGRPPLLLVPSPLVDVAAMFAAALRFGQGVYVRASRAPEQPLELWSFEASPYCRIVREALCTLEIPYLLRNVAKGSPRRPQFLERSGKIQVPFIADPNTGVEMFESNDIVRYLEETYGPSDRERG
jgi:glutathione S-transferase